VRAVHTLEKGLATMALQFLPFRALKLRYF